MFRRRAASSPASVAEVPPVAAVTVDRLVDAGWVLPKGIAAGQRGADPAWTLVGTVGSPTATPVDPAGLVVGEGWSIDWWLGADDRWHHPAREAAVRQQLAGEVPIVETLVRIPGGDAVHRAYGIRSPRATGDEWVVVEVENRTPVPIAVGLVIRPLMADGLGSIGSITVEPVEGGSGRDTAHLVRIDGRPALVLPRRPLGIAAGNLADGDVADEVASGRLLEPTAPLPSASCPDGAATLALVYPVPHTATFKAAIPVGLLDPAEAIALPGAVPGAATVESGWEVHQRGPRFEIPERRLRTAVERARTQVLLAHDGDAVHRDGVRSPDLDPGATEVILGALDLLDRPADVGTVVARWIDRLASASPAEDALFLTVVARHWQLHRIDALLDWMLPEVAAAVERIDRADRRGHLADPIGRGRAAAALVAAGDLMAASGQVGAASKIRLLADRFAGAGSDLAVGPELADRLVASAAQLAAGEAAAGDELLGLLAELSPTGAAPGPGRGRRRIGHDLAVAGALVQVGRSILVAERPDGLAVLPVLPDAWYGGGVELHDAPTAFGRLSYAVRWHGTRPALLWDLEPHEGIGPVVLRAPGLDTSWSTTELRGDALLAEVAPPEGYDLVREVAEHMDIPQEMLPEGPEPELPPPSLPDGGTFS